MGYENGRDTLQSESALLSQLAATTSDYLDQIGDGNATTSFVVNGWLSSFEKLKVMNDDLASISDAEFQQALVDEKGVLEALLATASKMNTQGDAASWVELFTEDIAIIDGLLQG